MTSKKKRKKKKGPSPLNREVERSISSSVLPPPIPTAANIMITRKKATPMSITFFADPEIMQRHPFGYNLQNVR